MSSPNSDRIQKRAYEIWEREGRPHGRDEHHWHAAAREIEQEDSRAPGAAAGKQEPGSAGKQPRSKAGAQLSDSPAAIVPGAPVAAAKPKRTPKPKAKK